MAKVDIQYDIINDTPASASPVEANFNRLEQHINQELIERGGTVAMTAQLKLVGDPVAPLDAATKQYVDAVLPVGIIMMYGGTSTPPGGRWALCNGAEVESATYPLLFEVIANHYSPAGTPAGRFHLPPLVDAFPMGAGGAVAVGAKGGSDASAVPAHTHPIDHAHAAGTTGTETVNHNHSTPDHLHNLGGYTGGHNTDHVHYSGSDQGFVVKQSPGIPVVGFQTGGFETVLYSGTTGGTNTDHAHGLPGTTGASDRALTTSGVNTWHQHGFTTPAHAGASGSTGDAAAGSNNPKYVGVLYIIRVS